MTEENQLPEIEPGDVYFDRDGNMVFTRRYHQRRGYCCKSGCRHCPWGYVKKAGAHGGE